MYSALTPQKKIGATFINSIIEQSTLGNIQDIFDSSYGKTPGDNLIENILEVPLRYIPAQEKAIAKTVDPVVRSTYSKGDYLDTLKNKAQASIVGKSKELPALYDTWGEELKRQDSVGEGILQTL